MRLSVRRGQMTSGHRTFGLARMSLITGQGPRAETCGDGCFRDCQPGRVREVEKRPVQGHQCPYMARSPLVSTPRSGDELRLLTYIRPQHDLDQPRSGYDALFARRLLIALPGFAPVDIPRLFRRRFDLFAIVSGCSQPRWMTSSCQSGRMVFRPSCAPVRSSFRVAASPGRPAPSCWRARSLRHSGVIAARVSPPSD